jgi:hypothetical protein
MPGGMRGLIPRTPAIMYAGNERKGGSVLDAARLHVNFEGAVIVFCGASRRSSRGDTCHAPLPGSVDFGTGCSNASGTNC